MTPLTVGTLKQLLKKYDNDIKIAFSQHSEYVVMEEDDIATQMACAPRPDGWVQRKRPDKPTEEYLVFPGN